MYVLHGMIVMIYVACDFISCMFHVLLYVLYAISMRSYGISYAFHVSMHQGVFTTYYETLPYLYLMCYM